jgi:hypothetical protein
VAHGRSERGKAARVARGSAPGTLLPRRCARRTEYHRPWPASGPAGQLHAPPSAERPRAGGGAGAGAQQNAHAAAHTAPCETKTWRVARAARAACAALLVAHANMHKHCRRMHCDGASSAARATRSRQSGGVSAFGPPPTHNAFSARLERKDGMLAQAILGALVVWGASTHCDSRG